MPDAAAEILRQHRALLKNLHELVEALGQEDLQTNRRRLAEFLRNDFLPHAEAEREHLYPALSALINAVNRGSALLEIDHHIITAFAEEILGKIGIAGSEQDDAAHVRTLAVQLEALVLARMEKEERVCLPLMETFFRTRSRNAFSAHCTSHHAVTGSHLNLPKAAPRLSQSLSQVATRNVWCRLPVRQSNPFSNTRRAGGSKL